MGLKIKMSNPNRLRRDSKKYAGAESWCLYLRSIPQSNDDEKFPVFLGVGIALSMALVLITVFVLSFTTAKKAHARDITAASPTPGSNARRHQPALIP